MFHFYLQLNINQDTKKEREFLNDFQIKPIRQYITGSSKKKIIQRNILSFKTKKNKAIKSTTQIGHILVSFGFFSDDDFRHLH